jgi:hypothetical protein
MSEEDSDAEGEELIHYSLLGIVEKPCKNLEAGAEGEDDIKFPRLPAQGQPAASSEEETSESSEEESESSSSEEEELPSILSKKKLRRPMKSKQPRQLHASTTSSGGHPCPHCTKSFSAGNKLVQHIRVHTGEKPFKCAQCLKGFSQKGHL